MSGCHGFQTQALAPPVVKSWPALPLLPSVSYLIQAINCLLGVMKERCVCGLEGGGGVGTQREGAPQGKLIPNSPNPKERSQPALNNVCSTKLGHTMTSRHSPPSPMLPNTTLEGTMCPGRCVKPSAAKPGRSPAPRWRWAEGQGTHCSGGWG